MRLQDCVLQIVEKLAKDKLTTSSLSIQIYRDMFEKDIFLVKNLSITASWRLLSAAFSSLFYYEPELSKVKVQ